MQQDVWLPGHGVVPVGAINASKAVEDYDPDLMLGRNEQTGDWHVFLKNGPHGGQPFPVMYLGPELPPYDEIQRLLYTNDVRRHGAKIVEAIERRKRAERERLDKIHADENGEVAEYIEWGLRQMGAHPNPRIFVPSEKG
jgi:hypothetical protein